MYHGSKRTSNELEQANLFADFFKSNFDPPSNTDSHVDPAPTIPQPGEFNFDYQFVFEELSSINTKKGAGPDGIHPLLLKKCAATLAKPLHTIFNESLASGIFPHKWKRSSVSPVFKKGSRSNIENYRCIAKLPTIAKLFERLVNVKMLDLLRDKIVLNQHGFMKSRSTTSNVSEFINFCHQAQNNGAQIDVLYTDFTKAFDKVDIRKLINKLSELNLPPNLLLWLKSYLSNRRQFVKYGSSESSDFESTSGVPQGSHLGPTLFLVFINDIVNELGIDVFVSLFADDLKIAMKIKSTNDAAVLQQAIDKLKVWCEINGLQLNLKKCAVLTIHKNRAPIPTYIILLS